MRCPLLARCLWVLAFAAGLWPTSVRADTILLRDVRSLDGRAVISEVDASGSVVRQNVVSDSQQALSGQPLKRAMRLDAPLAAGESASTLSIQESVAGPLLFIANGSGHIEPTINSPRFTVAGSEAGSLYDVTFELLAPYRYQYNTFVERFHPEGLPSFAETRLSDSSGRVDHHLELFESGTGDSLSIGGVLRPGVYTLLGNARVTDAGANVSGRAQFGVELSLTPVPEPASMLLVGSGLAALVARARRTAGKHQRRSGPIS